jgi:hypothetical protein
MPEIAATEASRRFAELLDGVEHPASATPSSAEVTSSPSWPRSTPGVGPTPRRCLRRHNVDGESVEELAALRNGLEEQKRY